MLENMSIRTPSTIISSTYKSRVLSENRSTKNELQNIQNRVIGWDKYKKRDYSKNNSTILKNPIG